MKKPAIEQLVSAIAEGRLDETANRNAILAVMGISGQGAAVDSWVDGVRTLAQAAQATKDDNERQRLVNAAHQAVGMCGKRFREACEAADPVKR